MSYRPTQRRFAENIDEGWRHSTSFLGSFLSGMLIGWALDAWLNTDPWFIVIMSLAGAGTGFYQLWRYAKEAEERHARR